MKILIAGAGGMGLRFGIRLQRSGNRVTLVDGWQENIDYIRANGIHAELNGEYIVEHIPVYKPEEIDADKEDADLIIAFVKAMQLDDMFATLQPVIRPDTYVLCLMNGMGHEEVLKKYVMETNLLMGVTIWTAGMKGPGQPVLSGTGNVEIQELKPEGKAFAEEVVKVFDEAGLNAAYSDNVRMSIYRKICVNGTLNCLCTILNCNMSELASLSDTEEVMREIIAEFASVAECEGVHLDQEEILAYILNSCRPEEIGLHYPSMYQDLRKNGRKTEIEFINGACVVKARKYGLRVPYCELMTHLIHQKEELLKAK